MPYNTIWWVYVCICCKLCINLTEQTKYPLINLQIIIENIAQTKLTVNIGCLCNQHDIMHSHKNNTNRNSPQFIWIAYIDRQQFWKCDEPWIYRNSQLSDLTSDMIRLRNIYYFVYRQRIHVLKLHCNKEANREHDWKKTGRWLAGEVDDIGIYGS